MNPHLLDLNSWHAALRPEAQDQAKEVIKTWLKATDRDRYWLAEQCSKEVKTINNWLSSSRPIPDDVITIIRRLLEDDILSANQLQQQLQPRSQVFSIEVNKPTFRAYSEAALNEHKTLEDWAIEALNQAAEDYFTGTTPARAPLPFTPAPGTLRVAEDALESGQDLIPIDVPMSDEDITLVKAGRKARKASAALKDLAAPGSEAPAS